ncbi:MAG: NADH:flavin oxidoreductase [Bacteroidales bacterium]|nr:NADH:flavin oxidoreductase [Bacteroidales bacterium]
MLFTPVKIGPLTLRNRSIRAAAFEGMCPGNQVSEELINYHRSVAAGGIGMTTVAYASVTRNGLSFPHQLWIRPEILLQLKRLTDAIHTEGAAASIQLGHCGNMAKNGMAGSQPVSSSTHFNLYAPSFARGLRKNEIQEIVTSFGDAVRLAQQSGFDAVEIHAGHGYLISQFLSSIFNRRKDEFGGSLENRMRFMQLVMEEVLQAAGGKTAVLVKLNMRDGVRGGMETEESLQVAKTLENIGVDALVLSGGFVSRSPMYILRGAMPVRTLARHVDNPFVSLMVRIFGKIMIHKVPFHENYFLDDARLFRKALKMPLVYVGGILSKTNIDEVLSEGFNAVAIARALIKDPDFINKIRNNEISRSSCDTSNHCIAVMYNGPFRCHQNEEDAGHAK